MKNLRIAGLDAPVRVTRQRQKNITLSIHPKSGVVHVRAPRWVRQSEIDRFIAEQHEWVAANLNHLAPATPLVDGGIIPFMGQTRLIRHESTRARGVTDDGTHLLVGGDIATLPARLRKWLMDRARREVCMRTYYYADIIGKDVATIAVRDMHARWGSCTRGAAKGARLAYNWRLIFAPLYVLDYVVAHEVSHLQHMNHGKQFWALVTQLQGDYEPAEKWLAEQGPALMRVGNSD